MLFSLQKIMIESNRIYSISISLFVSYPNTDSTHLCSLGHAKYATSISPPKKQHIYATAQIIPLFALSLSFNWKKFFWKFFVDLNWLEKFNFFYKNFSSWFIFQRQLIGIKPMLLSFKRSKSKTSSAKYKI